MDRNYGDVVNRALELEAADGESRIDRQQDYDEAIDALVRGVIAEYPGLAKARAVITGELDDIAVLSEPGIHPVLDKVRYDLLGAIEEALGPSRAQSAMRTRLVGLGAIAAILLILGGAVALRHYNAIPISAPLDTRPGIEQRAAALAKVIRYDDWDPGTGGLRRLVVKLALWPFEPTESEILGAREFAGAVLNAAEDLQAAGQVCKIPPLAGTVDEAQIAFLSKIVSSVRAKTTRWGNPPAATVLNAIRTNFPC